MNRNRIVAVGNGDQLTEVTPYGVLLVYMWDPRSKAYIARNGDWAGTDGVNARRGLHIGNRVQSTTNEAENVTAQGLDDMEATMSAACNRLGY